MAKAAALGLRLILEHVVAPLDGKLSEPLHKSNKPNTTCMRSVLVLIPEAAQGVELIDRTRLDRRIQEDTDLLWCCV